MREKLQLLNEETSQTFDYAISWVLLFVAVLALWIIGGFAVYVASRSLLRRIDEKLYQKTCPHRFIDMEVYDRPARKFFRSRRCQPCVKCGKLRPIEEVKPL